MKPLVAGLIVLAFAACERQPTAEEIEAKQAAAEAETQAALHATPTPKPGDWMWKGYKPALDQPPKRH